MQHAGEHRAFQREAALCGVVHGGPFANIAHGCNSVQATRLGPKLADVVVTEAGFGADLGGEKFFDIKCRLAGLVPSCAVIVATVRALKMHGGVAKAALGHPDVGAVERGVANIARHVENVAKFGLPGLVAMNRFTADTDAEIAAVQGAMARLGTRVVLCTPRADGATGAVELARAVRDMIEARSAQFHLLYADGLPLDDKTRTSAREIYHVGEVVLPVAVEKKLKAWEQAGFGQVLVCVANTKFSFGADPTVLGAPEGHVLPVRDVRLSAGAGFVVAICGDIMTMPGLPRTPAAESIGLTADGRIDGLF